MNRLRPRGAAERDADRDTHPGSSLGAARIALVLPLLVACERDATSPTRPVAKPAPVLTEEQRAAHEAFRAAHEQFRAARAEALNRRPDGTQAAGDFLEALLAEDPEAIGVALEQLLRSLPPLPAIESAPVARPPEPPVESAPVPPVSGP